MTGFNLNVEETSEMEETVDEKTQPKLMEVESQTKSEWLCNRTLLTSHFEATFDGLVGDGQSIITEFVDWESSGPTYTFNELRDALCCEAKFCFKVDHISSALHTPEGIQKKLWTARKIELAGIEFKRHPKKLDALLEIDINLEPFYFQQSLHIDL